MLTLMAEWTYIGCGSIAVAVTVFDDEKILMERIYSFKTGKEFVDMLNKLFFENKRFKWETVNVNMDNSFLWTKGIDTRTGGNDNE